MNMQMHLAPCEESSEVWRACLWRLETGACCHLKLKPITLVSEMLDSHKMHSHLQSLVRALQSKKLEHVYFFLPGIKFFSDFLL